ALTFGAIELFVRRAASAERTFVFNDEQIKPVSKICQHLGGIPLAIELASSQIAYFATADLLRHLESHAPADLTGIRDLPTRQQTMRATLEWSYALLSDAERIVLRRLSVFVGGWTFEAA